MPGYVRGSTGCLAAAAPAWYCPPMMNFDDKQLKEYEAELKTFGARAFPFATKQTINSAAFRTRELTQQNIRNNMTTRNKFTERSIRVVQAKTLNVRKQEAIVGSLADYMELQEFGGVKTRKGQKGVPLATAYAAGQKGERTRLPRGGNKLAKIQLKNRRTPGKSRKARNVALVKQAAASKNRYIYMDLGRRRGIFRVTGGMRKPRVQMVWDLTHNSVYIPATPTLKPATDDALKLMPAMYFKAIKFQLDRHNLNRMRLR